MIESLNNQTTLIEARTELLEKLPKGTTCPCCNQHAQMYKRMLTSSMAAGLILLSEHKIEPITDVKICVGVGNSFIHIENFFKEKNCSSSIRGDVPKLRFWGLIKPLEAKGYDGYYEVTSEGHKFVLGIGKAMSHVNIYNNQNYGFDGKEITIYQALKNKFSYEKLMKGEL